MVFKKIGLLFGFALTFILIISMISANLEITKETISNLAIKEMNKPAIFNLQIKNLGDSDSFNIYTFVGINLVPNESFSIASGETKTIQLLAYPTMPTKVSPEYLSFEYRIEGTNTPSQIDNLAMTIASLKDSFDFSVDAINPDSTKATVNFNNKYGGDIENIHLEINSAFFSSSQDFSLSSKEEKSLDISIDRGKIKELLAGPYIVNAKIKVNDIEQSASTIMQFEEKSGIETSSSIEGIFLRRQEITKENKGNVAATANIVITRNIISALFTTINLDAINKEVHGLKISYIFEKNLAPGEKLNVVAKTNWWILIGIIILIFVIWYLIDKYVREKITINKKVSFVRTKGGEFALKINLKLRARDYVERIRLIDRLPPMVRVFEGYGSSPDKIDEKNKRLEWNIQALARGEEREFSYIIYSKIGMVGRFELPRAEAIYEFEGKIKEASSNDAFYSNEKS
jgi:hypothetical protein